MSLDSQTGGFNSAPMMNSGAMLSKASTKIDKKASINRVSPSTPTKVESTENLDQAVEVADKATDEYLTTKQSLQQNKAQKALKIDTFNSRTEAARLRNEDAGIQNLTAHIVNDKELKRQQAQNFVNDINNSELNGKAAAEAKVEPDVQQNQTLAATVMQSQVETLDPDAREKKKTEDKLQKISSMGGEKGKQFVSFVRREMSKGPLSKSILELVDGFLENLRPKDSLTPSEMIVDGKEPLTLLRSMVASTDSEEIVQIRTSIANSSISSAGERVDLLAIRNLNRPGAKLVPPKPSVNSSQKSFLEEAAEFAISINKGSLFAPWDNKAIPKAA